jgi:hypothetical protein
MGNWYYGEVRKGKSKSHDENQNFLTVEELDVQAGKEVHQ